MSLFELTLHVDHVHEDLIDDLIDQFDATTGRDHTGAEFVTVLASGQTFDEAARTTLTHLQTLGLRVQRAVPDLLSRSDIADRLGVTRQAVQNWINGSRKAGFPRALNPVSGGVWLWHDVRAWALANGRLADHGIESPTVDQIDTLNAWIAGCRNASWRGRPVSSPRTVQNALPVVTVTTAAWCVAR